MQRLFEDLTASRAGRRHGRSGVALPLSGLIHTVAGAAVVSLSIVVPEALPPLAPERGCFPLPPLPAPRAQAVVRIAHRRPPPATASRRPGQPMVAPQSIPDVPPARDDETLVGEAIAPCIACGPGPDDAGEPPGTISGTGLEATSFVEPLRISHGVQPPRKLRHLAPVYPEIAKQARISGVVSIECTIDAGGRVVDARVLAGPPLLEEAALDAVREWVYAPTLLSGVPVPVILTVTVRFALR